MMKYNKALVYLMAFIGAVVLELNMVSIEYLQNIEAIVTTGLGLAAGTMVENQGYDGKW